MGDPCLEVLKAWLDEGFEQPGFVEGVPVHSKGVQSR